MDAFIHSLLERLFATSVQTALLSTLAWLICRHLPRLSPSSQCWLWWLVALQALVGLIANPVELHWLPAAPANTTEILSVTQWVMNPAEHAAALDVVTINGPSLWRFAVIALWAGGFLFMGWLTLRERLRASSLVKTSVLCCDGEIFHSLERVSKACGLRAPPSLRLSEQINSPLLVGHLQPVVLMPARAVLGGHELDMAFAHELAHLRRRDLWWGWVPEFCRHLLFFHPFAHLAVREYDIAREAACDAAVMEANACSRRDYGHLLLKLGTRAGTRAGLAAASPTFLTLSRRLTLLQRTAFLPKAGAVAVLAVVAATGVMPLRLVTITVPPAAATTSSAADTPDPLTSFSVDRIRAGFESEPVDGPWRAAAESAILLDISRLTSEYRLVPNSQEISCRSQTCRVLLKHIDQPANWQELWRMAEPVAQIIREISMHNSMFTGARTVYRSGPPGKGMTSELFFLRSKRRSAGNVETSDS